MNSHVATVLAVNVILICVTIASVATRLFRQKTQARQLEAQDGMSAETLPMSMLIVPVMLVFAGICGVLMSLMFCVGKSVILL